MTRALQLVAIAFLISAGAFAQDNAALLERMRAMEDRIKSLEAEVADLKGQKPVVAAAPVAPQAPETAPLPTGAGSAASAKVFNPDIAVIGDFLGAAGNGGPRPSPAFEMHESEVSFQAILDPYARADFFISFGQEGVELEEGYLTFPALPGHFQLKAGKMRVAFGKVNTLHNHVLSWTDRPLVTQNLVGGEDGIDDAGFSLSRILPAPDGLFLEGTAQVIRGDSSDVFHAWRNSNVSTVGHLRAYRDIAESTNLDVGFSYARGSSPVAPDLINQLYGIDATVRWKPLRRSIYHSFVGRTELVWDRNDKSLITKTPFGYFVSADYQFARRWFIGGRFDQSERATSAFDTDRGGSAVLTYWPSEFSQIRGQLRRTSYAEGITANELLFQFMFSIGAHGAHPF